MIPQYIALKQRCCALRWPDVDEAIFDSQDLGKLDKAFHFAENAHKEQTRKSGELYIIHPVAVAELLLDIEVYDLDCLMAALLHDVVEDDKTKTIDTSEIETHFGHTVAHMVEGLTKLDLIEFKSPEREQAQNVMKMLLAVLRDPRVIIVKLADRLHNMRTLEHMPEEKQRRIATETMHIYVPIADMMGIRLYKGELEDLAIRFLDEPGCQEIEEWLARDQLQRQIFLQQLKDRLHHHLQQRFTQAGIMLKHGVYVEGRVKSMHGIHHKRFKQGRNFEEIFDIYALRVIVDSEDDCWLVQGWVNQLFHEIPRRHKNYISAPKQNGYQSLHLTMVGDEQIPFEVQIRTWDMHEIAERGVAGHWKYKQGIGAQSTGLEEQLARIKELIESYKDADSMEDVVQAIRSDISPTEKVYPITPKGLTKELKQGATVLDFAYVVHTGLGHRFNGAKVNGRIVPIDYPVQSGDVVEVMALPRDATRGPSRDWLQIVTTSAAKSKIRNWFKQERREENIEAGRSEVETERRRNFSRLELQEWEEILLRVLDRKQFEVPDEKQEKDTKFRLERLNRFYAALGYGGLNFQSFLPLLREEYQKVIRNQNDQAPISNKKSSDKGVVVEGIGNCQLKLAQCCYPLPQDKIIGYITRVSASKPGGVTIHRTSCVNVPQDLSNAPELDRWLSAKWDQNSGETRNYLGVLSILANDKTGLLADITAQLKHMHVNLNNIPGGMRRFHDGMVIIPLEVFAKSRSHLDTIRSKLFQIKGVVKVD